MYLMYTLNENGDRIYTLKVGENISQWTKIVKQEIWMWISIAEYLCFQKQTDDGKPTISAHPARFSPEDKYSRQRIIIKKRFGLLLTQQPKPIY